MGVYSFHMAVSADPTTSNIGNRPTNLGKAVINAAGITGGAAAIIETVGYLIPAFAF